MIFSEEDLKRLSARERRTLRGAAGTALAAALGGGAVPKGSLQTFTCEISNDTGYLLLDVQ